MKVYDLCYHERGEILDQSRTRIRALAAGQVSLARPAARRVRRLPAVQVAGALRAAGRGRLGMEISAASLALIKASEGFCATVYRDPAGIPTIGYGHKMLTHDSFPDGITEGFACGLLNADIRAVELEVENLVHVPLTQGQFDALVDFTYNLGSGRLASSTLLAELNAGRYDDAAEQLLRWDMAGGEVSPGLKTRREAELALWNGVEA